MKKLCLLYVLFSMNIASAVSLLQEEKEILCSSPAGTTLVIEKKDRYFETKNTSYNLVEFLDKAILGRSENNQAALVQILTKNRASLIEGIQINFVESDCEQVGDSKVCINGENTLLWSPISMSLNGKSYPVKHYGVYPNDGTYFMAYEENVSGLVLVDFGSKFLVLSGRHTQFSCQYSLVE